MSLRREVLGGRISLAAQDGGWASNYGLKLGQEKGLKNSITSPGLHLSSGRLSFLGARASHPHALGQRGARLPLCSVGVATAVEASCCSSQCFPESVPAGEMLDPVATNVSATASKCVSGGRPW